MDDKLITNNLTEIIGYDLLDLDLKDKFKLNPALEKEVNNWTNKYIENRHAFGIKECNVEYIDYENLDIEEFDEVEQKDIMKKIKKNERLCPNHRTCVLYRNNALVHGSKCILEVADASTIREALRKELDIKADEYNDIISVDKLTAINVIGNRALRALSSEALVEVVPTYAKGGVKYETKVNDNFGIFEKTQLLADKLQKALVLNRDDKIKYKRLVEGKTQDEVKDNVKNLLKTKEQDFKIDDLISDIEFEALNSSAPRKDSKKETSKQQEVEVLDIEG